MRKQCKDGVRLQQAESVLCPYVRAIFPVHTPLTLAGLHLGGVLKSINSIQGRMSPDPHSYHQRGLPPTFQVCTCAAAPLPNRVHYNC